MIHEGIMYRQTSMRVGCDRIQQPAGYTDEKSLIIESTPFNAICTTAKREGRETLEFDQCDQFNVGRERERLT